MDIKPIKTEADYETALNEIDRLMDAKPDTPEGDRLDVLTTLVEAWKKSITGSRTLIRSRQSFTAWRRLVWLARIWNR